MMTGVNHDPDSIAWLERRARVVERLAVCDRLQTRLIELADDLGTDRPLGEDCRHTLFAIAGFVNAEVVRARAVTDQLDAELREKGNGQWAPTPTASL